MSLVSNGICDGTSVKLLLSKYILTSVVLDDCAIQSKNRDAAAEPMPLPPMSRSVTPWAKTRGNSTISFNPRLE